MSTPRSARDPSGRRASPSTGTAASRNATATGSAARCYCQERPLYTMAAGVTTRETAGEGARRPCNRSTATTSRRARW